MRALGTWLALVVVLSVLTSAGAPPLALRLLWVVMPAMAAFVALGLATTRLVTAARRGVVVVDDQAKSSWGIWRRVIPIAVMAVFLMVGFLKTFITTIWSGPLRDVVVHPVGPLLVAGLLGIVCGAVFPVPSTASTLRRSPTRWLLLEGALPAAVVAAVLGVTVALVHCGTTGVIGPGRLARIMAGSVLVNTLLGVGGFAKAWAECRSGLVTAPTTRSAPIATTDAESSSPSSSSSSNSTAGPSVPSPLFVALVGAAFLIVVGPRILPTLAAQDVMVVKAGLGFVVGGVLYGLGAIRGWRAAEGADRP